MKKKIVCEYDKTINSFKKYLTQHGEYPSNKKCIIREFAVTKENRKSTQKNIKVKDKF